jgi:ribosomal protein L11 methyltransferase
MVKNNMEWIKVKIDTTKSGIDFVSGIFEEFGIDSLEIEDNEEFLQVLELTRFQWNYIEDDLYQQKIKACTVAAYLANNTSGKETLKLIERKITQVKLADKNKKYGSLEIFISVLNDEDWAENWKQYFKPIAVGENILVCPEWEDVPEEYKSRIVFKIDPCMCFGTGTHETTRLCAAALEKYIERGDLILDLGCGSGILFIIALLLGARFAVAADIDENSARISRDNAKINDIAPENYKVYTGNLLKDKKLVESIAEDKYNIILMNIVPDVIIPLLPVAKDLVADGGVCILSGIIGKYLPDIECACESAGFKIIDKTDENDWQCVVVKKKEI